MTTLVLAQTTADTGNDAYLLWGLILLAAALALMLMELFVPSGGLLGVLCGVAAIGSVAAFYKYDPLWGIVSAVTYLIATPFLIVFVFRVWINSPIAKLMILGESDEVAEPEEAEAKSEHARQVRLAEMQQLIGAEGVTVTALRPVGKVKINDRRVDALAEMGVIEANVPILVVDVYDNQIKVRPIES